MSGPEAHADLRAAYRELERRQRLYAMLSAINRAILREDVPAELYAAACQSAVEHGGFCTAWVALAESASGLVEPIAAAGALSLGALRELDHATGAHDELTARAGRPAIVNDMQAATPAPPWRAGVQEWGVRAGAAFPLRMGEATVGAFFVGASEAGFFRDAEIRQLEDAAADLSFALEVMRKEELRSAAESKIKYLAYYDAQTGMPSQPLFLERLAGACAGSGTAAVLVARLRHYHGIVQSHGAASGLDLIREAARRLDASLPALTSARVAEAEFAVLVPAPEGLHAVEELAWNIHSALAQPYHADGQELFLDPFIGMATFPQHGGPAELLGRAMAAAATGSANAGSGFCRFYHRELEDGSRRHYSLDAALRGALARGEFSLHFQPQVDLRSGRMVGAEALLRWHRPGLGLVSPLEFVPALEENRLIVPVGEWALHEACRLARQWQDDGLAPIRVAVNLSALQFQDDAIKTTVRQALDRSGLAPQWLELELTESTVLHNADAVIRTMRELNTFGLSHALDDFGTGYSSLSYLQRLPVERIKLDRSFVTHVTSRPGDAAIARAVVGMAHSLGLAVIAEGVETEGQLAFLRGLGCQEMQGYFFSRPLPAAEFADLVRSGRGIDLPEPAAAPERVLLVVDDEPGILAALKRALRRPGYRVLTAASAREGFELMATNPVGVVICDQRMPEMTGTEFLRRAKELHPGVIRIVLSGYTDLNSVLDAVNRGAIYKFLTKPWDEDALRASLDDAFRLYETRNADAAWPGS